LLVLELQVASERDTEPQWFPDYDGDLNRGGFSVQHQRTNQHLAENPATAAPRHETLTA